jgi:hypothetical protein
MEGTTEIVEFQVRGTSAKASAPNGNGNNNRRGIILFFRFEVRARKPECLKLLCSLFVSYVSVSAWTGPNFLAASARSKGFIGS